MGILSSSTFYMFKGHIAKVFISTKVVTMLTFPHPVEMTAAGWKTGEVFRQISPDKKVIVLKAMNNNPVDTNFVVSTKSGNYEFHVIKDESKPHVGIDIQIGKVDNAYKFLKETREAVIYTGINTVKIIPKKEIKIEGVGYNSKNHYLGPLGPPVFINGRREVF